MVIFVDSDYLFDNEHISQREIEKDLFEKFDKVSERSLSILKFIFVIVGFYSVVFVNIHSKLDISFDTSIITVSTRV